MNPKLLEYMRYTIDYLDELMQVQPTRELADTSNYLEALYQELKARGEAEL